jgi:tRNA G18 (ribose-2'-O)-methylase SpoU
MTFVVVLHNLRSALNVGAIFRTADALGISKIYLCGTSPVPGPSASLRTSKANRELAKTALGAENFVSWQYYKRTSDALRSLKQQKFQIIGLEQDKKAIDIRRYQLRQTDKIALVLGYEVKGISKQILAKCDKIIYLPMFGKKESLNVSVAFGVAGYLLKFKMINFK